MEFEDIHPCFLFAHTFFVFNWFTQSKLLFPVNWINNVGKLFAKQRKSLWVQPLLGYSNSVDAVNSSCTASHTGKSFLLKIYQMYFLWSPRVSMFGRGAFLVVLLEPTGLHFLCFVVCLCPHPCVQEELCIFQSDLQFGRETLPINNLNPRLLLRTEVGQNACLWVTQRYDIGCSFLIQVETEETKLSVQWAMA